MSRSQASKLEVSLPVSESLAGEHGNQQAIEDSLHDARRRPLQPLVVADFQMGRRHGAHDHVRGDPLTGVKRDGSCLRGIVRIGIERQRISNVELSGLLLHPSGGVGIKLGLNVRVAPCGAYCAYQGRAERAT